MTYTIEDIKRLVPESTDLEQFDDGSVTIEIEGLYINTDEAWTRLLLTTRRQLELAREALEGVSTRRTSLSDWGMMDRCKEALSDIDQLHKE